ncbi:hypothetical protein M0657_011852 [Pyricularia oryzae]|nr:hypothetical protein M0657_011852 [Pyricularia oryzae]
MSSQTSKNNIPSTPATNSKAAQKAPARPKDDSDSDDEEDQLRRQVVQTNQEFHEQTLRATQFQEELQALRASANVTSTPLDGRERFKFNPPTTFDSTPGQLKGYLIQVQRRQKVTDIFSTFAGYERTLRSLFQEPDEKRQTERDLANLRQTKSASAYAAEFRRLATRLDMTEETKILQFYQELKSEVKDEISKLDRPEDFLEYVELAIKFDNRIYERRQEKQGGQRVFVTSIRQANTGRKYQHPQPTYHRNNGGWQQPRHMAPQTYSTAYGTHSGPMDLNATQHKKPRKDPKSGKCFKCDKTGHIARNCPRNQEDIPDFRGKTEKLQGFNATNYQQLRPDQHSTMNWTTCYDDNCMEPLGQTHHIRTTNQSSTQELSEDLEKESSEEETMPSSQYNAARENNPYIYENKHIDLHRDDQLVQFPGLPFQAQTRYPTGPIFWAKCFRDNCGFHLSRKIVHNFFPRRRKATGIYEIYTTTDLPNWEIKIRLNTEPAVIFTPNDNYPMACCNQKQFPCNYISPRVVAKRRIPWQQKKEPYQLQTVEGKAVLYGNGTIETETVHLWMENYGRKEQITLDITEIGDKDVILGIPWLRRSNPRIDWTTGQIQWEEPLAFEGKPKKRTSRNERRAQERNQQKIMALLRKSEPRLEPTSEGSRLFISEERSNLTTLIDNIPAEYRMYERLFSPELETGLPEHNPFDHEIPLKEGIQPKFHKIYGLNPTQMEALDEYLAKNLKKGYIRPSTSPAGYPILFVPKKNGKLRLCVDYKQLNDITIKNCYPLPLIGELRDMLYQTQWFTTLDLKGAYNLIRIKEGEEWKTAFRTRQGHYKYLVMPFGLTNAPATFQTMINHVLRECLDISVVIYLDDILVFSKTLEEYKQHVHTPEKCLFHSKQINFLGYIIAPGEIRMEKSKIQAVKEWPQPQNVRDVRAFLGFVNFYRRFIKGYGAIATPLTNMTKKDLEFQEPILKIPDPTKPFEVETDASDYAIGGQLSQRDKEGRLHPCAFFSQKLHGPEFNYQIYDKKFMAIIRTFEKWKPQLSGTKYEVLIYTDHKNLTHFTTSKVLNKRQIKWSEFLSKFHFRIIYRKGTENGRADALSRRPDHENIVPEETRVILTTDGNGNLLPAHRSFMTTNTVTTPEEIRKIHGNKAHGHQGISKTWKRLKQHYNFKGTRQEVREAIKDCELCAKSKSARHRPYGLLQPLPAPSKAWQTITMDFIVKLPPSEEPFTKTKYDSILVIVDKLTKYAYFLLYKESSNAEEIAYTFLRVIVSNYGLPENIIINRDKLFTLRFWKSLIEQLGTDHKLSTAFHPQTDGQTERANQTLEQYLKCYINHK